MPRTLQVVIPRRPKAAKSEAKTEMTETCRKRWSLLYFFVIIYNIFLENTKKQTNFLQKTKKNKTTNTQKPTNTHMHRHTFRNNRRQILLRPPPTHRGGGMRSILKSAAVARRHRHGVYDNGQTHCVNAAGTTVLALSFA